MLHPAAARLGAALGLWTWRAKGRHRRLDLAQETVVSYSCLSLTLPSASRDLPKASADFQKEKHSLSMAPALSILNHSVPRCHTAYARLQQALAGLPLPWQYCQGSHLFLNSNLSCYFISSPLSTPQEGSGCSSAIRAVVTLHEVLIQE